MDSTEIVKSVGYNQTDILNNIIKLYCPEGFDLDPTYSKGVFYKNIVEPRLKFDLEPQSDGVRKADCRNLPLEDESVSSIIFDPPFVAGIGKFGKPGIIRTRFTSARTMEELWEFYRESLCELYRVLRSNGVLVIKCQDNVSCSKQYLSHIEVINFATAIGLYADDIFVLVNNHPIIDPRIKNQYHARKSHSYFLVFRKTECPVKYSFIT